MTENAFYTRLEKRGLIQIEGTDRKAFLQGLITNDIEKLAPGALLYACLLSPQGKFLHDFFIAEGNEVLLLECEGGMRAQDLYERLNRYRLRADVHISVEEHVPVYAVLTSLSSRPTAGSGEILDPSTALGMTILKDPRHNNMGYRSFEKPDLPEQPFETWDTQRIKLCIPDGSRDLIPEKSTMDEARMDQIGAIDYDKGCYVGQELTARMHYRGLGKKHLQMVNINDLPEKAELRSRCGDIGLALVRGDIYKDGAS